MSSIKPAIAVFILVASACVGDDTIVATSTTTTGIGDESPEGSPEGDGEVEEGVDETSEEGEGEGESDSGEDDGDCSAYPLPFETDDHFASQREDEGDPVVANLDPNLNEDAEELCPDHFAIEQNAGNATAFYVYRPVDTTGPDNWPDATLPLAVFVKANGGLTVDEGVHLYGHVFDELAADGFVVVAIDGNHTTAGQRRNAVLCATEWAQLTYASRLNCDRVLIAQSQGAYAIHNMVAELTSGSPPPPFEPPARLRAIVEIAPTRRVAELESLSIEPVDAAPTLVLHSPTDEQNEADGITHYDRMAVEDNVGGPLPIDSAPDKAIVWVHDVPHFAWGGHPDILEDPMAEEEVARGHAVSRFYIPAFLRWQVYGEASERFWFVAPTHYNLGLEAFPDEIQDSELWADLYTADTVDAYDVLEDRPLVFVGLQRALERRLATPPNRHDVPRGAARV
jgi:hypothetical protein